MAAEVLAQGGAGVTVYDAMPSAGRKFLMAGRGGLNLTHSEPLPAFPRALSRGDAASRSRHRSVSAAGACATGARRWGSRPSSAPAAGCFRKPSRPRRCCAPGCGGWTRWACNSRCVIAGPAGTSRAVCCSKRRTDRAPSKPSATVLALGGASWPRLGSDGAWAETLAARGVTISPLRPANCGFTVAWSDIFRDRFEGQPLKGVALTFGAHSVRGEAMITRTGIEGGAIYALSAELREAISAAGRATLHIALRPDLDIEGSDRAASAPRGKQSLSNFLRKAAQLSPVGDRLAAGGGAWHPALRSSSLSPAELARPDQRRADRTHRRRADRARDLDRGRDRVRRTRRRFHDRAACPACSRPAKCWTGKRRPAAICCRRRSRRAPRRGRGALKWLENAVALRGRRERSEATIVRHTESIDR